MWQYACQDTVTLHQDAVRVCMHTRYYAFLTIRQHAVRVCVYFRHYTFSHICDSIL